MTNFSSAAQRLSFRGELSKTIKNPFIKNGSTKTSGME